MKAIGCDVLSLSRFAKILANYDETTLSLLFTANEFEVAKLSFRYDIFLSVCFAGKESVSKALGRGFAVIHYRDIEVLPNDTGGAYINLFCQAKELSADIKRWELSWYQQDEFIVVTVNAF